MSSGHLEAPAAGEAVTALQEWASVWADLLLADMALAARRRLSDAPAHLFPRRALWEAAVIAYARTAVSGRRQKARKGMSDVLSELGADAERLHAEVLLWRDKHVAHRVDPARERVEVRAVIDPEHRRIQGIVARVSPIVGPEDESDDLVTRFEAHVKALRDLVWAWQLRPLERRVVDGCSEEIEALLDVAEAPKSPPKTGFQIEMRPSG